MQPHNELKPDHQARAAAGAPTSGHFKVLRTGLGPGLRSGLGSDGVVNFLSPPLVQTLADVLERGHKSGVFRAGVDPVQLYISIAGLSYFYLGNNHTLSTIFKRPLLGPKAKLERLSHMTDLVLGYLVRD